MFFFFLENLSLSLKIPYFSANIYPKCWILHKTRVKHVYYACTYHNLILENVLSVKLIREQWHYYVIHWRILYIFVSFFDFKLMAKFYWNYELLTFFFAIFINFAIKFIPWSIVIIKSKKWKRCINFFPSFIAWKLKL